MHSWVIQFRASLIVIALVAGVNGLANAQGLLPLAYLIVGNKFQYTVKAADKPGQYRLSQRHRQHDARIDESPAAQGTRKAGAATNHQ